VIPDGSVEQIASTLERWILDRAPVWEEQFAAGPGIVCGVKDAATTLAAALPALLAAERVRVAEQIAAKIESQNMCIRAGTTTSAKNQRLIDTANGAFDCAARLARESGTGEQR
jgi:hypothetical protein